MENIQAEILQIIKPDLARHYGVIPFKEEDGKIYFYTAERYFSADLKLELDVLFDKNSEFELISEAELGAKLSKHYRISEVEQSTSQVIQREQESFENIDMLIRDAENYGASDIHIEIFEEKSRIRYRIDGNLIEKYVTDNSRHPLIINKIKIAANLDIAEKRLPQDGRIFYKKGKEKIDVRVSVLPTLYGEKAVLRILSNDVDKLDINALGFSKADLSKYLTSIRRTNGVVLISGPTGSGKTTTLYATLKVLNDKRRNITTIEDPIEYTLEGVNQVQLKESIGLDFPTAIKTFLRQDPDVIMLGEIRDSNTASMAVRASLTGHLVLSTIHTNSAWGIISRLTDMGVPAYLIAETLNIAVAQRLIRLLCPSCKVLKKIDLEAIPRLWKQRMKREEYFVPKGCDECFYVGYTGRKAIYETITVNEEISECIKSGGTNLEQELSKQGFEGLSESAFRLFQSGQTSLEEVYPYLITK